MTIKGMLSMPTCAKHGAFMDSGKISFKHLKCLPLARACVYPNMTHSFWLGEGLETEPHHDQVRQVFMSQLVDILLPLCEGFKGLCKGFGGYREKNT